MISVIIPVYNEADLVATTISALRAGDSDGLISDIIVVDGGSTDATVVIAADAGARVVRAPVKGRAKQMNYAAALAKGHILYFLHADTLPPIGFTREIVSAIEKGFPAGCFMLRFDMRHWFLRLNCWFTQFNVSAFHYGDASLYIEAQLFREIGGYAEDHIVFEDYRLVKVLKERATIRIIKKPVITSARKYRENGVFKMQFIFYLMYLLYRLRLSQDTLVFIYKKLIRQDKL